MCPSWWPSGGGNAFHKLSIWKTSFYLFWNPLPIRWITLDSGVVRMLFPNLLFQVHTLFCMPLLAPPPQNAHLIFMGKKYLNVIAFLVTDWTLSFQSLFRHLSFLRNTTYTFIVCDHWYKDIMMLAIWPIILIYFIAVIHWVDIIYQNLKISLLTYSCIIQMRN